MKLAQPPHPPRPSVSRVLPTALGIVAAIAALHVAGVGLLWAFAGPRSAGGGALALGLGLTAYLLGARHAFDADHIAAIDNTTRKLKAQGRAAGSVGFWFAFGHAGVVCILIIVLATGARSLFASVADDHSTLHDLAGDFGALVSSGFLFLMAALNLVVLAQIWRAARPGGGPSPDDVLSQRGVAFRLLGPAARLISRPWHMVLVGALFSLGFDTASEVSLLVLTGSAAAPRDHSYAYLGLPILFAAGMTLFDTLDGSLMTAAYGWGAAKPARRVHYNLVITGLSIVVAVSIGSIQILDLIRERLDLRTALWSWTAGVDAGGLGLLIVALFALIWILTMAVSGARRGRRAHAKPLSPTADAPIAVRFRNSD